MDNVNKIISFILGLIVVVVFIAIVTGKFKIGSGLKNLSKVKVSPTVTVKPTAVPTRGVTITYNNTPSTVNTVAPKVTYTAPKAVAQTPKTYTAPQYQTTQNPNAVALVPQTMSTGNPSTIPNTGAPTLLIPTALSMLGSGVFLKKRASKK